MKIRIRTPSRLHFSLIDMNGELGRIDGGMGLALEEPNFVLEFESNHSFNPDSVDKTKQKLLMVETDLGKIYISVENNEIVEINHILETAKNIIIDFIRKLKNLHEIDKKNEFPIQISISDYFSPHIGLGSKTQLCLALASGIIEILDLDIDIVNLTELVGRGGTSGIGYRSFERGGFTLDGGHKFGEFHEKKSFLPSSASNARPAPMLLNLNFPEKWFILIIVLDVPNGASNNSEIKIFQENCPISIEDVREISHLTLMQILPSIVERDFDTFGSGVNRIQEIGFKNIEYNLLNQEVKNLISFQKEQGVKCVGISSFGPSVYSFFRSIDERLKIIEKVKIAFKGKILNIYCTQANNSGAKLEHIK